MNKVIGCLSLVPLLAFSQSQWLSRSLPAHADVQSLHFSDIENGVIRDRTNNLFVTADGGRRWQRHNPSRDAESARAGSDTAFKVGRGSGIVFKTTNRGASWFNVSGKTSTYVLAADFFGTTCGLAVGRGLIIKTADGGLSWKRLDFPRKLWLRDVHMVDELQAFVVGDSGLVARTHDGGATWEFLETPSRNALSAIQCFQGGESCYAAGKQGILLKLEARTLPSGLREGAGLLGNQSLWYILEEDAKVRVALFLANGVQSAELLDKDQPAGRHTLSYRSIGLPRGRYYVSIWIDGRKRALPITID